MNDILSITVDAALEHGVHEKKCAANGTKIRKNEKYIELHIIYGYPILKRSEKCTGVKI